MLFYIWIAVYEMRYVATGYLLSAQLYLSCFIWGEWDSSIYKCPDLSSMALSNLGLFKRKRQFQPSPGGDSFLSLLLKASLFKSILLTRPS